MENTNQLNELQPSNNIPKKSRAKKIILIIIILLAIGGVASYFMMGNFNNWKKISILGGDSVAVVNGEKITRSEFDSRFNQTKELAKSQGANLEDEKIVKEIEKTTLDEMINEKILIQDAKKKGLIVSVADVEKAYNEMFARFKTKDDFTKELVAQNFTEQSLRENIVKQLTLIKYVDQNIDSKNITVTDKEVSDLYKTLSEKQKNIPKFEQIKAEIENEIKQNKLRAKILDIITKLKADAKIEISARF